MTLDEKIPRVNWPTESGIYKVVQLDIDGQPHLLFAEKEGEHDYHSTILLRLV